MNNLTKMPAKISILACAHNEEKNIRPFWRTISAVVKQPFELIFLNDGSTDNTLREMQKIKSSNVKIISVLLNRGKNLVLPNLAFRDLNEIVITTDVDLEDDLTRLPKMIELVKGKADLIVAERRKRKIGFVKKVSSGIFNSLQRSLFGLPLKDSNCGLKVFKREAFQDCGRILKRKTQYRYIALVCHLNGYDVRPFPIQHFKGVPEKAITA